MPGQCRDDVCSASLTPVAVPLPVAVPAGLAALAYLNARTSLSYDVGVLGSLGTNLLRTHWRSYRGRLNVFLVLEERALSSSHAAQTLLVFEGRAWTYRDVYDAVLRHGNWLRIRHGVAPGEIVAMDIMNSPVFIFTWLGLWSIGARPAFINYNLTGRPLVHCIRTSTARLVLVGPELRPAVTAIAAELSAPAFREQGGPAEVVYLDAAVEADIAATDAVRAPDAVRAGLRAQDMAILIFTSGTTGLPKAAIVSWSKVNLSSNYLANWAGLKRSDVFYTVSPPRVSSLAPALTHPVHAPLPLLGRAARLLCHAGCRRHHRDWPPLQHAHLLARRARRRRHRDTVRG